MATGGAQPPPSVAPPSLVDTTRDEDNAAACKLGPDFQGAACLMVAEVAVLMRAIADEETGDAGADGHSTTSTDVFKLTKQYCEQFGGNTSAEALTQIRTLLHDSKLEEFELASIANLNPVNAEEAKALVPSVKFQTPARESADQILSDDQLKAMLDEMAEYRMAGM